MTAPDPDYKIGEIIKVKNRIDRMLDDYHWIILVMDKKGRVAMRALMEASGVVRDSRANLMKGLKKSPPKLRRRSENWLKPLTIKMILDVLTDALGYTVDKREIVTMERVDFYGGTITNRLHPVCEIIMTGPRLYYYSENTYMLYSVEKILPWKKNRHGFRKGPSSIVPRRTPYLSDTLNDRFVILKEIPSK